MVLGTAFGWSDGVTLAASILLAFFFGYALTSLPLLRSGLSLRQVAPLAFASDTLAIATMEIVDTLILVLIPGALDAHLTDPLFWGSLAVALGRGRGGGVSGEPAADRAGQGARGASRAHHLRRTISGDTDRVPDAIPSRPACRRFMSGSGSTAVSLHGFVSPDFGREARDVPSRRAEARDASVTTESTGSLLGHDP